MFLVRVGRHKESVASLCPTHSQLIADTICLLWRDLPGIKGHAYLVAEHVIFLFLFPPGHCLIAGFRKKKFIRHRGRITLIGRDIFPLGFLWIFPIVQTVLDCCRYGFPFIGMACQKCGCCQKIIPFPKKKRRPGRSRLPGFGASWPEVDVFSLQETCTEQICRHPAPKSVSRLPPASHTGKAEKQGTGTRPRLMG